MQTISLQDWSSLTDLERAFYEKTSYEYLLSYMGANKIEGANTYFKEYVEVIKTYDKFRTLLEKEIILPATDGKPVLWEVDFVDKYVTIKEAAS